MHRYAFSWIRLDIKDGTKISLFKVKLMLLSVCRTVTVNLTSGDLAAVLQGTLSPLQVLGTYSMTMAGHINSMVPHC